MVSLFFPTAAATRSFFPRRGIAPVLSAAVLLAGGLLASSAVAQQQTSAAPQQSTDTTDLKSTAPAAADPAEAPAQASAAVLSNTDTSKKTRKSSDKVVQSKDTVKNEKASQKARAQQMRTNPLQDVKSEQPDKQLYDKAMVAINKGRYEVARLDLQTLLSTYSDSEYQMRAKLAFADSWYREGGSAALAQAETEYHDFIIFFPNAPEAAEAQLRIGDIYFKQIDRPDRDFAKAVHAQEEYRTMLTQYPDSELIPQAKQHLREVQEVLATRESGIAAFYATHENWVASIARAQTVVDTYPLYSHIDDTLIGLGDAYAAQSRYIHTLKMPEDAKARLLKIYDDQAVAAYSRVVTQYAASPHVEDARDRLEAMNVPIPEPTPDQLAASQALEDSRQTYTLANRAKGLILHGPDTVQTARIGEPSLADPKATLAPAVAKKIQEAFTTASNPNAAAKANTAVAATTAAGTAADAGASAAAPATAMSLQDIPSSDAAPDAATGSSFTATPTGVAPVSSGGGTGMGVTILSHPGATSTTPTANGLNAVGPANTTELPPIEKAAPAPDAVNDVAGQKTPQGQAPTLDKNGNPKKTKAEYNKKDESSSTHKKKTGLDKLNPF